MIQAQNLTKEYIMGPTVIKALNGVTLTIEDGEFVSITGPSGAGKSTLLYQLSLLDLPSSGHVVFDGSHTAELSEKRRTMFRLSYLGFVFQDFALLPELTAAQNVMLPLLMLGYKNKDAYKAAEESLSKFGLGDRLDNTPGQLSGGQQQRVAIARSIVNNPKVLFADEPTASLDSKTGQMIIDIFKDLNKEGQTIVMVTHEKKYYSQANRIVKLLDGKIVE